MSKYIGTPVVNISADTVDVTGDITTTDTTPEVIIVNNTHEDTDGGREGKVTFKGQQSGGEETTLAQIQASHDGTSDDEKGDLIFKTNDGSDGASPTEAMRIDSAGKVGIGLTNAADYFADNLVVQAPAEGGITIVSTATTNNAYLMFADGTSGNEAYRGYIAYAHNSPENLQVVSYGYTRFYTSADGSTATERMRINANGNVHIADNQNGADAALHIEKTTPQLRLQLNGNSGYNTIESGGTNELIIGRSGTEQMRIDENGLVGIGSTNPLTGLEVKGDANNGDIITVTYTGTAGGHGSGLHIRDKRDQINTAILNNLQSDASGTFGAHLDFQTSTGGTLSTNMRLFNAGNLGVGVTSITSGGFSANTKMVVQSGSAGGEILGLRSTSSSGTSLEMVVFRDGDDTQIGTIVGNAVSNSTSYGTSSDYRVKENVVDVDKPIEKLKKLKPKTFNMISDPDNKLDGFLAHELGEVIPNAVHGVKDGMTEALLYDEDDEIPDGKKVGDVKVEPKIKPQQVDYGLVTPLLTAALQEAIAKIETLETKVAALEGE